MVVLMTQQVTGAPGSQRVLKAILIVEKLQLHGIEDFSCLIRTLFNTHRHVIMLMVRFDNDSSRPSRYLPTRRFQIHH